MFWLRTTSSFNLVFCQFSTRLLLTVAAAASLLASLGTAVAQTGPPSASGGTITVRGVVLTSSDHKPIEGAAVEIGREHSTLTDAQGRFVLNDVPSGIVSVAPSKPDTSAT